MFKSISFVLKENFNNLFRIYSIAKYEILSDTRDSKLGLLWNILNPLIQILTYWFAFGFGIRSGKPVDGIEFINWMLSGLVVWFFISPSITQGVSSIHSKANVITKMKFPVSILPTTIVVKEVFNHLFMLLIVYIFILFNGVKPNVHNFQIVYYMICAICFSISMAMITSVLNMFTRDVKKMVNACMRMLLYATPILWTMDNLPTWAQTIMKCNPIYYIVEGYRDSFFYHEGILGTTSNINETIFFWGVIVVMFIIGSNLLYKFKHKFIDLI